MSIELSSCFEISKGQDFYEISSSPEADHMLLILQNPNGVFIVVEKSQSDEEKHPAYIKYNNSGSTLNIDISWINNDQNIVFLNNEVFAFIDYEKEKVSCDSEITFGLWKENKGDLQNDLTHIYGIPTDKSLREQFKDQVSAELKQAGASDDVISQLFKVIPINDQYSEDKAYLYSLSDYKNLILYSGLLSIGSGNSMDSSICLKLESGKIYYSNDYDKEEIAKSPFELIDRMTLDDFPQDYHEAKDDMNRFERQAWRETKKEELKSYLIEQDVSDVAVKELILNLPKKQYTEAGGDFHLAEEILNSIEESMVDLKNKIFFVGSCGNGDFVTMDQQGAIYFVSHEEGSWDNFSEHSIKVANSPAEYSNKLGDEDFPFDYYEACKLKGVE